LQLPKSGYYIRWCPVKAIYSLKALLPNWTPLNPPNDKISKYSLATRSLGSSSKSLATKLAL
jgi:hypothetical protein